MARSVDASRTHTHVPLRPEAARGRLLALERIPRSTARAATCSQIEVSLRMTSSQALTSAAAAGRFLNRITPVFTGVKLTSASLGISRPSSPRGRVECSRSDDTSTSACARNACKRARRRGRRATCSQRRHREGAAAAIGGQERRSPRAAARRAPASQLPAALGNAQVLSAPRESGARRTARRPA